MSWRETYDAVERRRNIDVAVAFLHQRLLMLQLPKPLYIVLPMETWCEFRRLCFINPSCGWYYDPIAETVTIAGIEFRLNPKEPAHP